jgi:hypothetical protein
MNQPPASRAAGLLGQAAQPPNVRPNVQTNGFFKKNWGWMVFILILALLGLAIWKGVLSFKVKVNTCAGGAPGVGQNKEKGCLCNLDSECSSGKCEFGVAAAASGAAKGKCQ